VVVTGTSPTARQRELGARLRALRNDHDMTVEEVAEKLLCSATKISRLETGARRPSLRDVRDLCELYEVGESASAELMRLAREARAAGWWTQYDDLNLDPLIGLEEAATDITCYSMNYIPGLLQTEEYAQGIIKTIAPKMDPQIVAQRVEARMRRQQVLAKDGPPRYQVLLDESVLRRGVGGPVVMAAQLDRVLAAVARKNAVVQVIPFDAGAYVAADGYFVLLEFAEERDLWPVVFIEGLAGNQYLERKVDIARFRETIDYLRARALSSAESVKLMTKVRNILRQQGNNYAQGLYASQGRNVRVVCRGSGLARFPHV
jgi:transcriptional regulator with XRE-family HTH domain